jgi:hypothetical protein
MTFEKLVELVPRLRGRRDAGALLDGLIKAALADEGGQALDRAIANPGPTQASAAVHIPAHSSSASRGDERS